MSERQLTIVNITLTHSLKNIYANKKSLHKITFSASVVFRTARFCWVAVTKSNTAVESLAWHMMDTVVAATVEEARVLSSPEYRIKSAACHISHLQKLLWWVRCHSLWMSKMCLSANLVISHADIARLRGSFSQAVRATSVCKPINTLSLSVYCSVLSSCFSYHTRATLVVAALALVRWSLTGGTSVLGLCSHSPWAWFGASAARCAASSPGSPVVPYAVHCGR